MYKKQKNETSTILTKKLWLFQNYGIYYFKKHIIALFK